MAKTSIGWGKLYLFSSPGNTQLIVTAHGGKRQERFNPPKESLLYFCSAHGKSTATDADDLVTALRGDLARERAIKNVGFHPHPVGDLPDYDLSKFAGKHGGGQYENYDEYEEMSKNGFDIVSPRSRFFSNEVKLSYVLGLDAIKKNKYKKIYCTFCRS